MKIKLAASPEEVGFYAFEEVKKVLKKGACTLGLATGSTPIPLYEEMVKDHLKNHTSYRKVTTFNLDEYVGLPKDHPQSYISFMYRHLFSQININMKNVNIPNGLAPDIPAECARYSALLENATIDLQILGIGRNGHIAFNEPNTPFDSKTHQVKLTPKTLFDNARFFSVNDKVPESAITMGLSEIIKAKSIVLLATGKKKADAVYELVYGPVTPACPASILKNHPDTLLILDFEAAERI